MDFQVCNVNVVFVGPDMMSLFETDEATSLRTHCHVMKAERPSTSMDFLQDPACSHSPTVILCQADAGNVLEIVALLADLRNSPEDVHVAVLTALQDVALITLLHAFGVATIVQLPADSMQIWLQLSCVFLRVSHGSESRMGGIDESLAATSSTPATMGEPVPDEDKPRRTSKSRRLAFVGKFFGAVKHHILRLRKPGDRIIDGDRIEEVLQSVPGRTMRRLDSANEREMRPEFSSHSQNKPAFSISQLREDSAYAVTSKGEAFRLVDQTSDDMVA